jgi:hypothetical protein
MVFSHGEKKILRPEKRFSAKETLFLRLENWFLECKKRILWRNRRLPATAGSSSPGSLPVFCR